MTLTTPAARALWEHLVQWQPATAADLTQHLRDMPDDWPLRLFNVGRADAALALPPGAQGEQHPDHAPEIAPYDEIASLDDCPACTEADENCRFHTGFAAGHHDRTQDLLEAVKTRPDIALREFLTWQADVSEAKDRGQEPPEMPAAPPAPTDHADELTRLRAIEAAYTALVHRAHDMNDNHLIDAIARANRETADTALAVLRGEDAR